MESILLLETTLVVFRGVDIDLKVDPVRAHIHAWYHRRHFDTEQIMRHKLHLILHDRLTDVKFLGRCGSNTRYDSRENYQPDFARCASHDDLLV